MLGIWWSVSTSACLNPRCWPEVTAVQHGTADTERFLICQLAVLLSDRAFHRGAVHPKQQRFQFVTLAALLVLPHWPLQALTELSLADNQIQQLPEDLSGLTALRKAHLYGNHFTQLPMGPSGLPSLLLPSGHSSTGSNGGSSGSAKAEQGPVLSSLWLEANPLSEKAALELLDLAAEASSSAAAVDGSRGGSRGRKQPRIGLDDQQLTGQALSVWQQQQTQKCTIVKRGLLKVSRGPETRSIVVDSCQLLHAQYNTYAQCYHAQYLPCSKRPSG